MYGKSWKGLETGQASLKTLVSVLAIPIDAKAKSAASRDFPPRQISQIKKTPKATLTHSWLIATLKNFRKGLNV